ncbi:MAG TPA: O-antigen ligase family protein [bacterium]|nr:O-antigen ligase family protein [bacterium]
MQYKERLLGLSKKIFFILIFLIPINLGKHFEIFSSYVGGVLVDYLVPTIFVQDILILLVVLFWLFSGGFKKLFSTKIELFEKKEIQISFLFIFSLFISIFVSTRFVPSFYAWLRMFIYFLFFIYTLVEINVEDNYFKILDITSISVFLLSLLAIIQFLKQGSVFNNYLILGEQPYSAGIFGIAKEHILGRSVIPVYGLFRHPNAFGGYLAITLSWLFCFIKKRKFYLVSFLFGFISIIFTFSYISWFTLILGIVFHLIFSKNPTKIKKYKESAVIFVLIIFLFSLSLPTLKMLNINFEGNRSITRRIDFTSASYRTIKDNFLFGVGFNNFTVFVDKYNYDSPDLRFLQPVHNIFLLIFSESGIFGFLLFISLIGFSLKRLINSSYFHVFLISLLQIVLLGSFDHYLFTMHQTLLLFWIIFGLSLQ